MQPKATLQLLDDSINTNVFSIEQEEKTFELHVQGFLVNYCYPDSEQWNHGKIYVYHEPKSKLYGWNLVSCMQSKIQQYTQVELDFFSKTYFVYLHPTKLVVLYIPLINSGGFSFDEYHDTALDIDDVRQKVLKILENKLEIHEGLYEPKRKRALITESNRRFWHSKEGRRIREGVIKLRKISYHNSQWRLDLESVDERHSITHKYGGYILDDEFNMLEAFGDVRETKVQIIEESLKTCTFTLHQQEKDFELLIQGFLVNFCFPDKDWEHGVAFLFYEPETKLYGWDFKFLTAGKKQTYTQTQEDIEQYFKQRYFYLLEQKMVIYTSQYLPEYITFRKFTETAADFDTAYQLMLHTLKVGLRQIEQKTLEERAKTWDWMQDNAITKINKWFWESREEGIARKAKIYLTQVIYQDEQWRLELESIDNNHPITCKKGTYILEQYGHAIDALGDVEVMEKYDYSRFRYPNSI